MPGGRFENIDLMLDPVGRTDMAIRLCGTIDDVLNENNIRTRDLGGSASTQQFAQTVIRADGNSRRRLSAGPPPRFVGAV